MIFHFLQPPFLGTKKPAHRQVLILNGGVGEIRTLAGFNPPNDLANRPLQPLEYHSV